MEAADRWPRSEEACGDGPTRSVSRHGVRCGRDRPDATIALTPLTQDDGGDNILDPPFSRNHRRPQACTARTPQHHELDPAAGRAIWNACGSKNQVPKSVPFMLTKNQAGAGTTCRNVRQVPRGAARRRPRQYPACIDRIDWLLKPQRVSPMLSLCPSGRCAIQRSRPCLCRCPPSRKRHDMIPRKATGRPDPSSRGVLVLWRPLPIKTSTPTRDLCAQSRNTRPEVFSRR